MVYKLPTFPPHILAALENREPICREDKFRNKMVGVLFDDLLQYGAYVNSSISFVFIFIVVQQ
jgi:hypothetical protein